MLELFKASSIHVRHFSENFGIFTQSLIFNSAQTAMGGPLLSLSLISLSLLIRWKSLCWVKVFWVLSVPASFLSLLSFQFPTNPDLLTGKLIPGTDWPGIQPSSNLGLPQATQTQFWWRNSYIWGSKFYVCPVCRYRLYLGVYAKF